MSTMPRSAAAGSLWLLALSAVAQTAAPAAPLPQASAVAAQTAAPAGHRAEAVARVTVIEDEGVRIEETRLRGAAQRITVQSKVGNVREYEILVGRGGSDPSQDRGAAGQRAWRVFGF